MPIGEIEGLNFGQSFANRRELYDIEGHRALETGIVGQPTVGAESIVVSGGYVDDEDHGAEIVYTGLGGRDPDTRVQIADQQFTRQNAALVRSCNEGLPVRVFRGANLNSPYAPETGYRYDGLYNVVSYWAEIGQDGFRICRFNVVTDGLVPEPREPIPAAPARVETTTQRIIRNTRLGIQVKELYDYRCQVCGTRIEGPGGPYAEAAHIKPLGRPHNGPDTIDNILCLCPNHHAMLDKGAITINQLNWTCGENFLTINPDHEISPEYIIYHQGIWN